MAARPRARGQQEFCRWYERIELEALPSGELTVTVREACTRLGDSHAALPLTAFARLERNRDGKAASHLMAQGPREQMQTWGSPTCPEAIEAQF